MGIAVEVNNIENLSYSKHFIMSHITTNYLGGGEYRNYRENARGNRRPARGNAHMNTKGEVKKNPNFNLQEKYKDDFNFNKHELVDEQSNNQDVNENDENTNIDEKSDKSDEPNVQNNADDFFDTFSNSTTDKKGEMGEGNIDRSEMYKMNAETFGLRAYNPRYRNNRNGRNRGPGRNRYRRGYHSRGYNGNSNSTRGGRGAYRGKGFYHKNDEFEKHGFKRGYHHNEQPYDNKDESKYDNKGDENEEIDHRKQQEEFAKPTNDDNELSFPEYRPPRVHYRGAIHQRGQPRGSRGKFF